MNKKFYEPKYIILSGVFLLIFGIFMPYFMTHGIGFIRGIIIGMGFGVIFSNLFRLFKIEK